MLKWLKKYFIPHEHNDHKPHLLRSKAVLSILVIILLIEVYFLAQTFLFPKTNFFALILQSVLIDETNSNRQSANLPLLEENPLLDGAAKMKAGDMAEKSYFAHVSPEGVEPWEWFKKVGYDYTYAGENLAINFFDSEDVIKAWLNSSTHRQNIFNQHFTEIGIGTAKGIYQGRETIFIVQLFGRPAQAETPISQVIAEKLSATSPVAPSEETFVAVRGVTESAPPVSALTRKMAVSPRTMTNYLYAALAAVISVALLLTILIKVKIQHPRLILNGIILLFIINAALFVNQYLVLVNAKVF